MANIAAHISDADTHVTGTLKGHNPGKMVRDVTGPDPNNEVTPGNSNFGMLVYDTTEDDTPTGVLIQLDSTGTRGSWVRFSGDPTKGVKVYRAA